MTQPMDHTRIIDRAVELLDERYIYPEVGNKMIARLRERLPDYQAITELNVLAKTITDDLQAISHDKHLHMDYNPVGALELLNAGDDSRNVGFESWVRSLAKENYGFQKLEWLPGGVGYLDLRWFPPPDSPAGDVAVAAMAYFAHAKAIIFDIRNNGGGSPLMVQLLMSYLFEGWIKHLNTFYTRHDDTTIHFWTQPYVPGKRLPNVDVYVLTSNHTFSGAEEFAYNMKMMERGTLIGETTGGGANPGEAHALNEQFTLFVPDGQAINPITKTNWEGIGVEPHIATPADDALRVAQVTALEKFLSRTEDDTERKELNEYLANLKATEA